MRHVQHLRDREEIEAQASLTIKYEFILPSDLPEFTCRADRRTCLLDTRNHSRSGYRNRRNQDESRPISVWIRERSPGSISAFRREAFATAIVGIFV